MATTVKIAGQCVPQRGGAVCANCGWPVNAQPEHRASERPDIGPAEGRDPLLVPFAEAVQYDGTTAPRRRKEERRFKRLDAKNMKACIRVATGDDVVEVLNISRRGLRFSSFHLYQPETKVQISAPFTVGGNNNIFQTARIVRAHRRPTETVPGDYAVELLW